MTKWGCANYRPKRESRGSPEYLRRWTGGMENTSQQRRPPRCRLRKAIGAKKTLLTYRFSLLLVLGKRVAMSSNGQKRSHRGWLARDMRKRRPRQPGAVRTLGNPGSLA